MMDKNTKKKIWGSAASPPSCMSLPKLLGKSQQSAEVSTERADDGLTPDCAGMRKNRNRWLKQKLWIGTWNVKSKGAGKLENIILETNENNIHIIGMAEHRWQGKGHFTSRCGGKVLYSGGERAGQNGVAIYLSKRAAQSLMGYNPVNDRLISVRLRGQAKNVKLIQVYAPTSAATDEEIETFHETLQQQINNKDRQDILIIYWRFEC